MDVDVVVESSHSKRRKAHDIEFERSAPRGTHTMDIPYRDLDEGMKRRIRAGVKAKSTHGLDSTEARWVEIFLQRNFATGRGVSKRGGKGKRSSRGGRSWRKQKLSDEYHAPQTLTTLRRHYGVGHMMATPVDGGTGEIHRFSPDTAAFIQAVGSPFTDLKDMPHQRMPRRPDPDFRGSSVPIQNLTRQVMFASNPTATTANASASALIFKAALPFSLSGLDVRGNQFLNGVPVTMPATKLEPDVKSFVNSQWLGRLNSGQTNYPVLSQQFQDFSKVRSTAAGLKTHDVGPVLTAQGMAFGHEVNYNKFMNSVYDQVMNSNDADLILAYRSLGIGILMDYPNPSSAFTTPHETVQRILQNARQAGTANAEVGAERTPQMGLTQRYREPRGEVDFTGVNPLIFGYDPDNRFADGTTVFADMGQWSRHIARFQGAEEFLTALMNVGSIKIVKSGSYFYYLAVSTTNCAILNQQFLPMLYVENILSQHYGNQGNSLLCMEWLNVQKDGGGIGRTINVYTANWAELQVTGTSALYQTDAPYDGNYNEVINLCAHMPVTVSGFSFFSNLWDGVKKAAKWVVKNQDSIINGANKAMGLVRTVAAL